MPHEIPQSCSSTSEFRFNITFRVDRDDTVQSLGKPELPEVGDLARLWVIRHPSLNPAYDLSGGD